MPRKTVKTVKVSDSTAEEWEEYVEENPEADSISHLIRLSVQKQLSGDYDLSQRRGRGDSDENEATGGEALTRLRRIETTVKELEERLASMQETESAEASYSLQKAIYAILPEEAAVPSGLSVEDYRDLDEVLSSHELAKKLDADIGDVDETLRRMDSDSGLINVEEAESGELYAWRELK